MAIIHEMLNTHNVEIVLNVTIVVQDYMGFFYSLFKSTSIYNVNNGRQARNLSLGFSCRSKVGMHM